jgi:uncharacterized protein YbjT (DUF2867 family)
LATNNSGNLKTALMLGGSGLVGRTCLSTLLQDNRYGKVVVLARRALPLENPKVQQIITDFSAIGDLSFNPIDDLFCALGTTIRKAGSQQAFRSIDLELPLAAARRSLEFGAQQFILVSAVDANPQSRNFYLRTKGELEEKLRSLPFTAVHILRPSFLLGARDEPRFGESLGMGLAQLLQFALVGRLRCYRPIRAADVGHAMVAAAKETNTKSQQPGSTVYEYDEIRQLAGS